MQDRFKFRAYNTYTGEFIKNICNIGDYAYMEDDDGKNFHFMKVEGTKTTIYTAQPKKDWVIMQCTGLKDKNGTLIYEGDIVKIYQKTYSVIFDNRTAYFGLKISNVETNTLNNIDTQVNKLEVIGNIYENKELLNELLCEV